MKDADNHPEVLKRMSRKNIIVLVGIALLVSCLALAMLVLSDWPVHHFDVVRAGVLYRGGQPDAAALDGIITKYAIKTDVNLRGADRWSAWWQEERRVCEKRGVRMVDIPLADPDKVSSGLKEFLVIVTDPASQPVFVHCEAGSARTGYAVAAYRIVVEKWPYDRALREAESFRFNPDVNLNPEYCKVLQALASGLDWHKLPDAPSLESTSATTSVMSTDR
jgi:hypothetical protein